MRKNSIFLIASLLFILMLVVYACKKNEDDTKNPPQSPTAVKGIWIYSTYFFAEWTGVENVNGYKLDVATDNNFANFVAGYNGKDVGNKLIAEVKGLEKTSTYYYR
ncbi:MAG: hypothetical protein U9R60_09410, partial [Bacteroidota bacterium]|nr:hypothetical protein [Bacteroidota bacterium]